MSPLGTDHRVDAAFGRITDTPDRAIALRRSAGQAWAHRDTPTTVHVDTLGRPFLEQRAMSSTKDIHSAYTDTTDVHLTLDLQGSSHRARTRDRTRRRSNAHQKR